MSAVVRKPPFLVTGRFVLICLITFFLVVAAVNAIMIRFAVTTFGGVETDSSYKAGLAFKAETAASKAQVARGWNVEVKLVPGGEATAISVTVRNAEGRPVSAIAADITLAHPADRRRDVVLSASPTTAGSFRADAPPGLGRRTLSIELTRDGERLFRSVSRVVVP